jgi:AcrR family transcriptional regulator
MDQEQAPATAGGRSRTTSREELVRTAVEAIDAHGLEALSMRTLAKGLGVSTMGLYRYVRTKEELLALLPEHLLASTAAAVLRSDDSATALREVAGGLRGVLERHPRAAPLFARPTPGPAMTRAGVHCATLLQGEGARPEEAFEMVRAVVAQVVGESLTSHGGSGELGLDLVLTGIERRLERRRSGSPGTV